MKAGIVLDTFENGNIATVLQMKSDRNSPMKVKALHSADIDPHIPQVLDKVNSLMDMMNAQACEIKVR